MSKQVWRQPVLLLAIVNIAVALLAFAKDILLAAYAGTSLSADALTIAYFIPDSLSNNLFAAAISVVCVPFFARLAALGQYRRLRKLVDRVSLRFVGASLMLLAVLFLGAKPLVGLLNLSASAALDQAILPMLKVMLPTVVFFVVLALGTAVLQSLSRFVLPALAPLVINLFFLGGVLYCSLNQIRVESGVNLIAVAIAVGVCLAAVWMAVAGYGAIKQDEARIVAENIAAQPESIPVGAQAADTAGHGSGMMGMFIPYFLILFGIQAVYFAERLILTGFAPGAAAALNYAYRLTQLPVWVFVAALSTVLLPQLSGEMALQRKQQADRLMLNAFRGVVFIVLPATLFLYLLREPLTIALFRRGAFDAHSVQLTSGILQGYSLSVLFQSISIVCLRISLAENKMAVPLAVFLGCSAVTVGLDVMFTRWWGPQGIGFGAAAGALLNAALLLYWLYRRLLPGARAILAELAMYRTALFWPLIYFAAARWLWFRFTGLSPWSAILYIMLIGLAFLPLYIQALPGRGFGMIQSLKQNPQQGEGSV